MHSPSIVHGPCCVNLDNVWRAKAKHAVFDVRLNFLPQRADGVHIAHSTQPDSSFCIGASWNHIVHNLLHSIDVDKPKLVRWGGEKRVCVRHRSRTLNLASFTYSHTDRHTHTLTHTHTQAHTDTHRHTHTGTHSSLFFSPPLSPPSLLFPPAS